MSYGIFLRLVGVMPAVVMGIFDTLRDAVVGAIEDVASNVADVFTAWATWGIETQLKILSNGVLPSPKEMLSGPVSVLLGANYGLAVLIVRALVVFAVVVTMIRVFQQQRTEIATRTLSSAIWLLALTVLFFPVYALLMSALREFCLVVLAGSSGSADETTSGLSSSLLALLTPGNLALQFVAGFINGAFGTFIVSELATMAVGFMVLVMFYPLSVVLRPFGTFGLNQFRIATAGVVSIPLSLIAMSFLLAIELILIQGANTYVPFLGGFATLIFSLIFGFAVALAPIMVFILAYSKVTETVGSMDAKIQSAVDVASMPDINARQINEDNTSSKLSYVKDFTQQLPVAIASGENDPGTEAKELGKQIAIQAAVKSGNPYVAAAAVGYTAYKMYDNSKSSSDKEGGDST